MGKSTLLDCFAQVYKRKNLIVCHVAFLSKAMLPSSIIAKSIGAPEGSNIKEVIRCGQLSITNQRTNPGVKTLASITRDELLN